MADTSPSSSPVPLGRRHKTATIGGSILATVFAVASVGVPQVAATVAPGFDWSAWSLQAFSALLPLLTIVVTYYARLSRDNKIPKAFLPLLGVFVATLGDQLASLASSHSAQPILAAALGMLGSLLYVIAKEYVGDGA